MIKTQRLDLLSATVPMLDAVAAQDWPLLSTYLGGVHIPTHWTHFPEAMVWMRDHLLECPEELGWWSYFVVHQKETRLIGSCGFKGMPEPDGTVEIGYEITPMYQNLGFATELVMGLVQHAFAQKGVTQVRAETLPGPNASCRVLEKMEFDFLKFGNDPEVGETWVHIKRKQ